MAQEIDRRTRVVIFRRSLTYENGPIRRKCQVVCPSHPHESPDGLDSVDRAWRRVSIWSILPKRGIADDMEKDIKTMRVGHVMIFGHV